MNYTTKQIDGFEIRFYTDKAQTIGCLYRNGKPVGIRTSRGETTFMEKGNNVTSIIKKLKTFISLYNAGKATIVPGDEVKTYKFLSGDILVENETNVATIDETMYVLDAGNPYSSDYELLKFVTNGTNTSLSTEYKEKEYIDAHYTSIGKDTSIKKLYEEIGKHSAAITRLSCDIGEIVNGRLNILNKTNEDFYKDLSNQISKLEVSQYEKEKYLEFLSAAYNNSKDK